MNKQDVESFLRNLHDKMIAFDVVYRPRDKNLDTLAEIEIAPIERNKILKSLIVEDCFSGPNKDTFDTTKPDYYEFGKIVKGKTIYIKISLGLPGKRIDCMSFHIAERPIIYPLKSSFYEKI